MRYAICNETFGGWEHDRICGTVAELGYTGLELAPFMFASRITDVSAKQRTEIRQQAESAGLTVVGLHWLLAKTEGFMLTSPDESIRKSTAEYLGELAKACRDMGGSLMVLGSPLQRRIPPGTSYDQTTDYALDTLSRMLPVLDETGVDLCLEPLAPAEADFFNTAAESVAMMQRLHHPKVKLHLDVKAMSSESQPVPEIIRQHIGATGHFHANDANKRGPGFGEVDFKPIFAALKEGNYGGWVSVEVFDYTPDPVTIARESIRYMRECA